jgi:hypothetical protein
MADDIVMYTILKYIESFKNQVIDLAKHKIHNVWKNSK